jgi:hypothetical protein
LANTTGSVLSTPEKNSETMIQMRARSPITGKET